GGAYTVNNGGSLGGTGTIPQAISVLSGGAINPRAGIGAFHPTGAISIASGGIFRKELQGALSDVLGFGAVGTLNIASGGVANFSLVGNITTTQFTFLNYSGSNLTGSFGTPTFTTVVGVPTPTGATITNDTINHQLILTVSPQSLRGNFNLD